MQTLETHTLSELHIVNSIGNPVLLLTQTSFLTSQIIQSSTTVPALSSTHA